MLEAERLDFRTSGQNGGFSNPNEGRERKTISRGKPCMISNCNHRGVIQTLSTAKILKITTYLKRSNPAESFRVPSRTNLTG